MFEVFFEKKYFDLNDENYNRVRKKNLNRRRNFSIFTNLETFHKDSRQYIFVMNIIETNALYSNNKYKNIADFHGIENSRFYDLWRTYLYVKFRKN